MDAVAVLTTTASRFRDGTYFWVQNQLAATKNGRSADIHAPLAAAFCAVGGICRTLGDDGGEDINGGYALGRKHAELANAVNRAAVEAGAAESEVTLFDLNPLSLANAPIFAFNDEMATSADEVADLLDRAATFLTPSDPED